MKTNGLTEKQVLENREKFGNNSLIGKKSTSFLKQLLISLGDPIIKILIIALAIKTLLLIKQFDWYETVGIAIAIFLASFVSTISEYGSEKAFEKLQEEASKIKSKVKRNNEIKEINIDDIVIDDIVLLESGDKIPADGYIIDGNLMVNESSLNGEPKEINKYAYDIYVKEENKVYRGSTVSEGQATIIVTSVGNNTLYGKLALSLQENTRLSPLKKRLQELATFISKIGYLAAILVFFSYLFSILIINNNFEIDKIIKSITNFPYLIGHILHGLTLAVTIIVVAVPEGLPMMITLVLSTNMKKMLKDNVLVRKLVGIETAGNINVLFTDKTGTLTKGKLELIGIIDGDLNFYNNEFEMEDKYHQIFKESIIYNTSSNYNSEGKIVGGNITERSLLEFIKTSYILSYKKLKTVNFDSKNKYSSTTVLRNNGEITYIKGAKEVILPKCNDYYSSIGTKRLFKNKKLIEEKIKTLEDEGNRIIVIATYEKDKDNLTFVGIALIKDDIRLESIEGLKKVKDAYINVVMITGDNINTAKAIGRQLGLITNDNDICITSSEFNNMSDNKIKEIFPNLKILARALPQDKSRLVAIAQDMNLVVGMTGDGVNDAPALKAADVGFALGSGTEIAKEASDIVILDNNLLSISKAILYGRTIFKSIRKFIIFQLTINLCAIGLSLLGPFIGISTPITVIQMLWINIIMDTLAGLAFSYEPPIDEYMKVPPKKNTEKIVNKYMLNQIVFSSIYSLIVCILFLKLPFFHSIFRDGTDDRYLLSAFFGLFIFMGIFNAFNARTQRLNIFENILKNKAFLIVIFFIAIVQILLIYFGGSLFRTVGLNFIEFEIMLLVALSVIPIDFIRKLILRKKGIFGGV